MPVLIRTLQGAFFLALAFFCSGWLLAADPKSETQRGEKLLDAYLRRETQGLADSCRSDVKTKEDWLRKRPELHRQFLEMLGLWPLPPRTDLKPVITGKIDTERFIVEKPTSSRC